MGDVLEIKGLKVKYGAHEAVGGINMNIAQGSITAIIGSNGAGKTTIINAISGLVKYEGSVLYKGEILPAQTHKIVKKGIVQVPEGRKIFAGLTVEENLIAGAYSVKKKSEVTELLEQQYEVFPRLRERKHQDAGTLSGGEQQMLAISRGLMSKPQVLILDEPSLGLAPVIVKDVFNNIERIKKEGITIILVEQNAQKSLSISDSAYVIENGHVVMSGTGREMLQNPQVAAAYLGANRKNKG
jgi:branched-chain amino acid transport system ATP-binding protein